MWSIYGSGFLGVSKIPGQELFVLCTSVPSGESFAKGHCGEVPGEVPGSHMTWGSGWVSTHLFSTMGGFL